MELTLFLQLAELLLLPGLARTDDAKPEIDSVPVETTSTSSSLPEGIHTYVTTPGARKSSIFSVKANGKELFVEAFRSIHYARLAASDMVEVEIVTQDPITSCFVSPRRLGIKPRIMPTVQEGRRALFVVDKGPQHLLIRFNGLPDLILIVDPPEQNQPTPSDPGVKNIMDFELDNTGRTVETEKIQQAIDWVLKSPSKHTLYFPNGCYRTGSLAIGGDMKIYLQEGALIRGAIDLEDYPVSQKYSGQRRLFLVHDAQNFELYGRGVIDGEGAEMADKHDGDRVANRIKLIETICCRNVAIRDVILRNSSNWACLLTNTDDSLVYNVKILNVPHHWWMDGFDVSSSQNIRFERCFVYTHDDPFAIMALNHYPGLPRRETRNILVKDCTAWTLCSGTRIGWNSNEMIDEVTFENVDFIFARLQSIAMHGLKDGKHYGTIRFLNCRFERGDETVTFFHSEGPTHEPESPFDADSILFEHCRIDRISEHLSKIIGGDNYGIKELHFRDTIIDNELLDDPSDLARMNIRTKNVIRLIVTGKSNDDILPETKGETK